MPLNFLLRKPIFPAIIDTGNGLVGARSWSECKKKIEKLSILDVQPKPVIDSVAEGFAFYPGQMIISPFTTKKRWTKAEMIALYNQGKQIDKPPYEPKSLGNKSIERVVGELVDLLSSP